MIDNFRPTVNYKPKDYNNNITWRDIGDADPITNFLKNKIPNSTNEGCLVSFRKSDKKVGYKLESAFFTEPIWLDIVVREDGVQDVWWWTASGHDPFDPSDPSGYFTSISNLAGLPLYYLDIRGWRNMETGYPLRLGLADDLEYYEYPMLGIDNLTVDFRNTYITGYDENRDGIFSSIYSPVQFYVKDMTVEDPLTLLECFKDTSNIVEELDMSGLTIENNNQDSGSDTAINIFDSSGNYNNGIPLNISGWTFPRHNLGNYDLGLSTSYYSDINASGWNVDTAHFESDLNDPYGVIKIQSPSDSNLDVSDWTLGYHYFPDITIEVTNDANASGWNLAIQGSTDWDEGGAGHYACDEHTGGIYIYTYNSEEHTVDASNWTITHGDINTIKFSGYADTDINISGWTIGESGCVRDIYLDGSSQYDMSYFAPSSLCFTNAHNVTENGNTQHLSSIVQLHGTAESIDVSNWDLNDTNSLQNCFGMDVDTFTGYIDGMDSWDISGIHYFDDMIKWYDYTNNIYTVYNTDYMRDYSDLDEWRDNINSGYSFKHILPPLYEAADDEQIPTDIRYPAWNGWFDMEGTYYPYQNTITGIDEIIYKGNYRGGYPSNPQEGYCYGIETYESQYSSDDFSGYHIYPYVYTSNGWYQVPRPFDVLSGNLTLSYNGSGITTSSTASEVLSDITGTYYDTNTQTTGSIVSSDCVITSPNTPYTAGSQRFYVEYAPSGEHKYYTGYFVETVEEGSDPSTAGWITATIPDDLVIYPNTTGYEIIEQIMDADPDNVSYHNPVTGFSGYAEAEDLSITDPIPPYQVGQTEFTMLYEHYDEGYDVTYHSTYAFTRPVIPAAALQLPMTANYGSPVFDFDYVSEYDTKAVCREPLNYSNVLTRYNADFSTSLSELPSFCNHFMNPVSYGTPVTDFGADRYDIPIFTSLQYNNYNLDFTDYNFVVFNVGTYASGARRNMGIVYVPKNKFVRYINGELYSTESFTAYKISGYGLNEGSPITNWQFSPSITEYTATLQNGYYKVTISSAFNDAMFSSIPIYWSSDLNTTGTDVASIMADTLGYASVPMTGSAGYNYFINCNGVFHEPTLMYEWDLTDSRTQVTTETLGNAESSTYIRSLEGHSKPLQIAEIYPTPFTPDSSGVLCNLFFDQMYTPLSYDPNEPLTQYFLYPGYRIEFDLGEVTYCDTSQYQQNLQSDLIQGLGYRRISGGYSYDWDLIDVPLEEPIDDSIPHWAWYDGNNNIELPNLSNCTIAYETTAVDSTHRRGTLYKVGVAQPLFTQVYTINSSWDEDSLSWWYGGSYKTQKIKSVRIYKLPT